MITRECVARSHTPLSQRFRRNTTWKTLPPRALAIQAESSVKRAAGWPPGQMPIVAACVARGKLRSAARLAGNLRAAGCCGEMRELAGIGTPTFEIKVDLGRREKSGSRSAQAVELTANRMSETATSNDDDGETMRREDGLAVGDSQLPVSPLQSHG